MADEALELAANLCGDRPVDPVVGATAAIISGDVSTLSDLLDSLSADTQTKLLADVCLKAPDNGTRSDLVNLLLRARAKADYIHGDHGGRAALHIAAERGQEDVVLALLKGGASPHKRTSSYETALHCAIRGCKSNTSTESSSLACIKHLFKYKVDVDARDNIGDLTAVHLAATFKLMSIVKCLLDHHAHVDIEINGTKARELIANISPDLVKNYAVRNKPPRDLIKELFSLLKEQSGENKFIKTVRNNRGLFDVDATDGHRTLLQTAVWYELFKATKELIDLQADVNAVGEGETRSAVMLSCVKGHDKILECLLRKEATDLSMVDNKHHEFTALHVAVTGEKESPECVRLLLEHAASHGLDINARDYRKHTALHYAAKRCQPECIQLFLAHNANIFIMDDQSIPAFFDIDPQYLSDFLDERMTLENAITSDKHSLVFNYTFLATPDVNKSIGQMVNGTDHVSVSVHTETPAGPEMLPLQHLASSPEHRHLLNHPLIRGFLHLKWHRIYWFFYLNFIVYAAFTAALSTHIYLMIQAENKTSENTSTLEEQDANMGGAEGHGIAWWVTLVLGMLLLLRELSQLYMSFWRYISHAENWLEMSLLGVTLALLWTTPASDSLAAVAILLAYTELVLLAGRHPNLATYITMFFRVSGSFICFLMWYSMLIVAFGFSFYIIFRHCDPATEEDCDKNFFVELGTSIFKTIVMLSGEFEAADLKFESYSVISHIIFLFFLFFIAIVLLNLLNGLAVSDTQAIRNEAEVLNCMAQVKLYSKLESTLLGEQQDGSKKRCQGLARWIGKKILLMHRLKNKENGSYKLCVRLNKDNAMEPDVRDSWRKGCTGRGCCLLRRSSKLRKSCRWCFVLNTIVGDARAIAAKHGRVSETQRILQRLEQLEKAVHDLAKNFVTKL